MKQIAAIEVALGLILVALSCYFMLEAVYFPAIDRHGYILGITIFGASLGALLAFAGVVLYSNIRLGILAHLPFATYAAATYVTWFAAYA